MNLYELQRKLNIKYNHIIIIILHVTSEKISFRKRIHVTKIAINPIATTFFSLWANISYPHTLKNISLFPT